MLMARELIDAIMEAERIIDEQIRKLTVYEKQIDDIMLEIFKPLDDSNQQSGYDMKQQMSQTQSEISQTIRMLEASKTKLMRVRET